MVRNTHNSMETTFYEENSFRNRLGQGGDANHLKRSLTLDLDTSRGNGKRTKFSPVILSTPDANMCDIGTPDLLDKFIISHQLQATPTPTTPQVYSRMNRTPTEEQVQFTRGFDDALFGLHNASDSSDLSSGMQPGDSSSRITYTNLEPNGPGGSSFHMGSDYSLQMSSPDPSVIVKDEPQTVPSIGSTPPLSPINMECQEKIKLERKRQRNRVAASKCRRRKLERISKLEDKVKLLKGENSELGNVVHKLKDQVCQLKEQVMDHYRSGCKIMMAQNF